MPLRNRGRLGRIALCRNTLLGEALHRLPNDGLLITIDLDCQVDASLLGSLLPQLHTNANPAWDLLTANSEPYRDLWALRSDRLGIGYDCWQDSRVMAFRGSCLRYRISIHPKAPVLRVLSAFNGASVLRLAAVRAANASGCRYPDPARTALAHNDSANRAVCEHAVLNECLHAHGLRIGIAPTLQTSCPCGAICGDLQRYFFREQLLENGTLLIRDHRSRRPFPPELWARFVAPMCNASVGRSSRHISSDLPSFESGGSAPTTARGGAHPVHGKRLLAHGVALGSTASLELSSNLRRLKERVAPPSAPTVMC